MNEVVKNPNSLLLLFSPARSRQQHSSNLCLQIHLRHQFQQLNHTTTSTHKTQQSSPLTIPTTTFSSEKRNQSIFKIRIGKQRVGVKKIEESEVVTRRNRNTNLVFFRQIQGMTENICMVKYFMDLEE